MKIRTKLTLIFTLVTAFLILALSVSIYFFSLRYQRNAFYAQLKERAQITGQMYLKKDEVDSRIYQEIRKNFFRSLPEEVEQIYSINKEPRLVDDTYNWHYSERVYHEILTDRYSEFISGKKQAVGLLYKDNLGDFIIIVQAYDKVGHNELNNLRTILITGFLMSIVFVFVLGKYLAFHALAPIKAIVKRVNEISASNLNLRVQAGNGQDEIAELSDTFNNMLNRLETSFEMQKTFISNASHELRNPLTAIMGEVEVTLSKNRKPEEYQYSLEKIANESERLQTLICSLLSLSQSDLASKNLHIENIRIDEFIWELKELVDQKIPDNQVVIELVSLPEKAEQLLIQGNKMLLMTAFTNILENACKFSANDLVKLQLCVDENGIQIKIIDLGIGMPEKEISCVWEPFYRCSNARGYKGFGIGLALSNKIIRINQGIMQITSQLNKGTQVSILFPHKQ